jgi:hypothetical protein
MARNQTRTSSRTTRPTAAVEEGGRTAEMVQTAMARTSPQSRNSLERGMDVAAKPFAALGENAFETWMRGNKEALRRALELNVELASWSREQLDDSMHAVRSLSQCRSVGDAYSVQLGLVRSSMENSLRHANKVFSLTAHAMAVGAGAAGRPEGGD